MTTITLMIRPQHDCEFQQVSAPHEDTGEIEVLDFRFCPGGEDTFIDLEVVAGRDGIRVVNLVEGENVIGVLVGKRPTP